jgi:hypothetical protein
MRVSQKTRTRNEEKAMGVGMEIDYLGFAGSVPLEAEAGAQLVRLERFGKLLSGCHLAIEALRPRAGGPIYDVRLDLMICANEFRPVSHCVGEDAGEAVRRVFDAAEKELETVAACARRRATARDF